MVHTLRARKGEWYTTIRGDECWHTNWDYPYIINLDTMSIWKGTESNTVAGPFDTLDAAKAAYLMLLATPPNG